LWSLSGILRSASSHLECRIFGTLFGLIEKREAGHVNSGVLFFRELYGLNERVLLLVLGVQASQVQARSGVSRG
jgi:hypothetical protein